jgi:hypothetical protein
MLAAAALISLYADWVPARWASSDPKSLELLSGTPINCLWLERPQWSSTFLEEAAKRGIATVAVIHREGDSIEAAQAASKMKFDGVATEGDFDDYTQLILAGTVAKSKALLIESVARARMKLDGAAPIVATYQALWPGIHVEAGGTASAGPTANPWIDTNTGFIRFARASTDSIVWLTNRPPPKTVIPVSRYLQAVADAEMSGARWVISLDDDFSKRLLAGEEKATADWRRIGSAVAHYETHPEWRGAQPAGGVAIVEDLARARLSAGLFDMLTAKHIPVVEVPAQKAAAAGALKNAVVAVETDPGRLDAAEKKTIEAATAGGGKVVAGADAAKALDRPEDVFTYDPADTTVATIWQQVDAAVGNRNLGVRLFNVASMLSNLLATRGQRQMVLHLVNYSDYPAQGVTVRIRGTWRHARLYRPGERPLDIQTYKAEDGTGIDIDQRFVTIATLVIE